MHFSLGNSILYAITHYISIMLPQQIRFGLFRFRSPLLTKSHLISFPRPTQMLHFGQFALPSLSKGVYERPHSDIPGSTVACTYPRLIAACHVLLRLPSLVIHQPASLHQLSYSGIYNSRKVLVVSQHYNTSEVYANICTQIFKV